MVVWNDLVEVCHRLDFPEEAVVHLEKCYYALTNISAKRLQKISDDWLKPNTDWRNSLEAIATLAQEADASLNSARMVLFLYSAIPLLAEYQKRGLSESLFCETLQDLRYKLLECYSLHGEWGTFELEWYRGFYLCERFALGRLQYEKINFPHKEYKGVLKEGDRVYSCHIPSSGPLLENDVIASLKRAYSFYRAELKNGILPVVCHSWLLYQPLETVFAGSGNILKFRNMFDVIDNHADSTNRDFWRVFYQSFSAQALNEVSPTTRLQKNLKDFLLNGQTMGAGFGVLLFDGEKIIND